jgi:hypothetical protein
LTQALHSATSSTATKFVALEGLPRDEEPVLDLLEGVLSWDMPGEEPLFFPLLLMVSLFVGATAIAMAIAMTMALGQWQSIVPIAINDVGVGGRGAPTRSNFIPSFIRKS